MTKNFSTYKNKMREIRRNEGNLLLNYILKLIDTCHRWEGNLDDLISILFRYRKSLEGDYNNLENLSNEYIFQTELNKIRINLNIRGVKTFISRKHGETHIAIDKCLENDFSGYYFCEKYMYQVFN